MSKPEYWWCVKTFGNLIPESSRFKRKRALEDRIARWKQSGFAWSTRNKLPIQESVVRIRVEEVPKKKGGRR